MARPFQLKEILEERHLVLARPYHFNPCQRLVYTAVRHLGGQHKIWIRALIPLYQRLSDQPSFNEKYNVGYR